jgi:hypothetical protein
LLFEEESIAFYARKKQGCQLYFFGKKNDKKRSKKEIKKGVIGYKVKGPAVLLTLYLLTH